MQAGWPWLGTLGYGWCGPSFDCRTLEHSTGPCFGCRYCWRALPPRCAPPVRSSRRVCCPAPARPRFAPRSGDLHRAFVASTGPSFGCRPIAPELRLVLPCAPPPHLVGPTAPETRAVSAAALAIDALHLLSFDCCPGGDLSARGSAASLVESSAAALRRRSLVGSGNRPPRRASLRP